MAKRSTAPTALPEFSKGQLADLTADPDNANKHTADGMELLENQIRRNGLARGVVVDKNRKIIGGNGVVEAARNAGMTKALFVPVTGDELVVSVRTDVDLDTPQGRELALADNGIGRKNLDMDEEVIRRQAEAMEIDLTAVGLSDQDMAAIRASADATDADTSTETRLSSGDTGATVKAVLRVPQVRVFERAIAATGLLNRADALMEVCRAYVNSKGQLDPSAQDQAAPADARAV